VKGGCCFAAAYMLLRTTIICGAFCEKEMMIKNEAALFVCCSLLWNCCGCAAVVVVW